MNIFHERCWDYAQSEFHREIFRMNPDEYDCEKVSLESRIDFLAHCINYSLIWGFRNRVLAGK